MTAPNIVNVTTITGKTNTVQLTTSLQTIVANAPGSNTVIKVNSLYVANIDGASAADVTIDILKSPGVSNFHIAKTVSVPADATLDVISKSIYLEEGDTLRGLASANGDLDVVCSYEVIE